MLTLGRKPGEYVMIGDEIMVKVVKASDKIFVKNFVIRQNNFLQQNLPQKINEFSLTKIIPAQRIANF